MAFVQVNTASQALRIAAFIVAFFSSFFSYSAAIDFSKLQGNSPASTMECRVSSVSVTLSNYLSVGSGCDVDANSICLSMFPNQTQNGTAKYYDNSRGELRGTRIYCLSTEWRFNVYSNPKWNSQETERTVGDFTEMDELLENCPPNGLPNHVISNYDGDTLLCYSTIDIDLQKKEQLIADKKEDYCEGLVLDSGNNSGADMCYSSSNGNSCNVQKVTTDGGDSYYKGVSSSAGGCYTSENPEYDDSGTGSGDDNCLYSNGINYCEANRAKHCSVTVGVEICDDGCIDDGTNVFCDTSRHPDVGEGDSNYFDSDGTCSVIGASFSRGFCNDMGGTWDETQDYQETSCPTGTGSCSVASAGLCRSCFDAGGTWTPDENSQHSDETKASLETGALIKSSNEKLDAIEHGQRMTMESMQSTIKSGDGKVVAAIEALGEKLASEEEEKESFTTTTTDPDKTKISALFDNASTATLKADIDKLKVDIENSIHSIRSQASAMMTITIPNSAGYQARNLVLTQGTFDVSLSRFSDFFKMLAAPLMLMCSILAGFILLGSKN